MKAVTWHGRRDVRITTTGICGSDLHLYEVLGPFMDEGDILGHEPMGIVEQVGSAVTDLAVGDRVAIPFTISCGTCFMCGHGLHSQCETTQVREQGMGAALFGYTKLYGQVPGGQAEYLRVPFGNTLPIKVPHGPPDERFVYLSDVLPTAWQAVEYAGILPGGSVVVLGLGPIGDMACRIARHRGAGQVIGVDLVPERLERAASRDVTVFDLRNTTDVTAAIRDLTEGRGPDAVIDAVGMEAHGAPAAKAAHQLTALLPDPAAAKLMRTVGVDRLAALYSAIDIVRRGGTISIVGVYGGMTDPLPMLRIFDKQIQLRMGQANVKRWIGDIMPLLTDDDPLGVEGFATHRLSLKDAPMGYRIFQAKHNNAIKVLFEP
ncbi:MAG: alcohol dehydrogenase catalytic domain-containing protein [Pseudonocardiaceae bacterium]